MLSEKDAANRTTSYAYDDAAGEVRLTWPTGQWVDYENDSLNRLETIRNSAGAALADYTYDTLSRVTAIDYGNGASQSYTYENDGDLDTVVQNFAGTTDDVTYDYAYNAAGQVTSKDLTNNAYLFTPGANATTSYTTNSLNQYTNIGGQAISYDTKGNLTSDGTLTFIYDSENKLKEAKDGAVTIGAYSYDPVGRRAEKTASGATTEYAYAKNDVIAEYDGSGTLLRRIVPGIGVDAPIAFYDEDAAGDPIFYLHYDGQGSVIGVSDSTGANTEKYTYGPFGETPVTTGSPYHYVARRIDQETGLYYVRARYYSPEVGRFLSPDPIGYGDGLNMYAYVSNDPVNGWDPTGTRDGQRPLVTAFIGSIACHGKARTFRSLADAQGHSMDQAFSYMIGGEFRCRIETSHVPDFDINSLAADDGGGGDPTLNFNTTPAFSGTDPNTSDGSGDFLPRGPHEYIAGPNSICLRSSKGCTPSNVFGELRENAAPGTDHAVETGSITSIPFLGDVVHTVNEENLSVTNTTLENHFLYPGDVVRRVLVTESEIFIESHGTGTGVFPLGNSVLAPPLWRIIDMGIRGRVEPPVDRIYGEPSACYFGTC